MSISSEEFLPYINNHHFDKTWWQTERSQFRVSGDLIETNYEYGHVVEFTRILQSK